MILSRRSLAAIALLLAAANAAAWHEVLAVAPGFVVNVDNNFVDHCFKDPTTTIGYRCPGAAPGKIQTNIVSVVQDDGVIARYAHLKRGSVPVSIGQRVECGTVVGKVGSSGRSAWSHLHFDMAQLALPQAQHAHKAGVRLYDRLFRVPHPGRGSGNYLSDINPEAKRLAPGFLEPSLRDAKPDERFQYERHGYFVVDRRESTASNPAFNRVVTLRDSWASQK